MNLVTFINQTGMFGINHIIFLAISVAVIIAGSILSVKYLKIEQMHKILLIVGIVSETIKVITYILKNEPTLGGYLAKTDLPFHLCSIQIIFILILNFSKNEKIKHLLHSFMIPTCLVGGIAALVLATSSAREVPVISIQYFGFHSAITVFAIYLLANKEIKFTVKDYRNVLIMLCVTFVVAIYLNSILYTAEYSIDDSGNLVKTYVDINFMYVVNPPQSGLPYLAKYPLWPEHPYYGDGSWLVYIIHYAALAVFVVTLTFIKPIIEAIKGLKTKKAKAK